jgi:hypothetical protein
MTENNKENLIEVTTLSRFDCIYSFKMKIISEEFFLLVDDMNDIVRRGKKGYLNNCLSMSALYI